MPAISMYAPLELDEVSRSATLVRLAMGTFGLHDASAIPRKLAVGKTPWRALLAALDGEVADETWHSHALGVLYRAFYNRGAEASYLEALRGMHLPVSAAGVVWQRRLGPADTARDRLDAALGRLRVERWGLEVRRHVAIAGEAVDWAIAGLLPNGEAVRVAIAVREPERGEASVAADRSDAAIAAAGFTLLVFRPWQLRWATACALAIAARIQRKHPLFSFPTRLHDPDDVPPPHRGQAEPVVFTSPSPPSPLHRPILTRI